MTSYGFSALASAGSANRYVTPSELVADWKVIPVSLSTNGTESDWAETVVFEHADRERYRGAMAYLR